MSDQKDGYWAPSPEEQTQFAAWLNRKARSWEELAPRLSEIGMDELANQLLGNVATLRWTADWLGEIADRADDSPD